MRKLAIIFFLLLAVSCFRLDDNLYNSDHSITEYKFDNYTGEVDFVLPASFDLPPGKINLISFQSGSDPAYKIYGVYLGDLNRIDQDTVIFYCHGNRDHIDFYWPRAKLLANVGGKNRFGVLMFDYRGFGLSEGEPTEEGLYEDARAALNWLKEKGLTGERLIMMGFSMGTAPATELTANPEPGQLVPEKLILQAPFASAATLVQDASILNVPGTFVTDLKIDNAIEIKKVQQPFLWIHGIEDDFLNIDTHGELVYKNYAGEYSEALRVAGAGHTNIEPTVGFEQYAQILYEFIIK